MASAADPARARAGTSAVDRSTRVIRRLLQEPVIGRGSDRATAPRLPARTPAARALGGRSAPPGRGRRPAPGVGHIELQKRPLTGCAEALAVDYSKVPTISGIAEYGERRHLLRIDEVVRQPESPVTAGRRHLLRVEEVAPCDGDHGPAVARAPGPPLSWSPRPRGPLDVPAVSSHVAPHLPRGRRGDGPQAPSPQCCEDGEPSVDYHVMRLQTAVSRPVRWRARAIPGIAANSRCPGLPHPRHGCGGGSAVPWDRQRTITLAVTYSKLGGWRLELFTAPPGQRHAPPPP